MHAGHVWVHATAAGTREPALFCLAKKESLRFRVCMLGVEPNQGRVQFEKESTARCGGSGLVHAVRMQLVSLCVNFADVGRVHDPNFVPVLGQATK